MAPEPKPPSPLTHPEPWDLVSEGYEKYTHGFLGKYSEKALPLLGLERSHRLVDIACGPGTTSLLAASQVAAIEAIDFSAQMIAIFRRHLAERALQNVNTHVGDGQQLPFNDASFERAVSMFGLMFFPDRIQGMREVRRVLVPGGKALLSSWAPVDMSPLMEAMFAAGRHANPDMPEAKRDVTTLENPELFRQELTEAGFVDITIESVYCVYEYEDGGTLWDEMAEGGVPLVLLRRNLGEEAWSAFSRTCREYLKNSLREHPELGSTAHIAGATRPS